ncbi:actin-like protein ARP6 [Moesziomyces antarcticus]|uniref:Related to ARP6 - Actin-related protein n=2 Tax=Pseudozyma antarctica TaxID=84753 RepID=A0A5C3FSR2_PSEA2|nr:actin-like protein ARP6 [Moesziomyces antarcticus]GAK66050.1 actin-like protein ARP6 [Moesziomyces antarcticus]SPO46825.1 related to ARP6 - Actin-related protein [Moesziomyces antarcticus]
MPASTSAATASPGPADAADPLAGVDHIIVIDNGAHNIRIASIPYPFPIAASSTSRLDPTVLAQSIAVDVFPNAIARTRSPHTISPHAASSSPTAPAPGTKTSVFVSSHIHTLLDDYAALHLRLPHQSGVVVDWAAQKTIWDHVLANHLAKLPQRPKAKGRLLAGKAVLIAETYLNLEPAQHATDLLLFEHYGASAVWRTTPAALVGLGTPAFATPSPVDPPQASSSAERAEVAASGSKRSRSARTEAVDKEQAAGLPRVLAPRRPQSMLVLDLGYSFCHAVPIVNGQVVYPAVRRLELGAKMLINLLKETLSFRQLDTMDESWLVTHIFRHTSFVAAEVGARSYGANDDHLARIRDTPAALWTYNDLMLLAKQRASSGVAVTWRLPDYGGTTPGAGEAQRDRARYGYIVDGPNPASKGSQDVEWESAFIASEGSSGRRDHAEEHDEVQTLVLESERYSMLEHLFNPAALELDQQGLPELVASAISAVASSSQSLRAAADMMWANIVLVGGLSGAVNMRRRLHAELAPLAPADVPLHIVVPDDPQRAAVDAGVVLACEIAAERAVRDDADKPRKKRPRLSSDARSQRWMTYAQWAEVDGAANAHFYPPRAWVHQSSDTK